MDAIILDKDDQYVLNHCTKYLARDNTEPRHIYGGMDAADSRSRIAEAWRFPVIDSYSDGVDPLAGQAFNEVTFIYTAPQGAPPAQVGVTGTFAPLYDLLPMRRVADTPFFTVTVRLPKGERHYYRYLVDGEMVLDPINPQQVSLDNERVWSRFFTQGCSVPLVFERWEREILQRLVEHILPFRSRDAQNFLARYYDNLDDRQSRDRLHPHAYRYDRSVGVVNYIDKLLAREESHHLLDYQIGLDLMDQVLRLRNPFIEPEYMPRGMFEELYEQMGDNNVAGWDYSRYGNPRYFLKLLRRHTVTGAFAHPGYGGNAGAAGWAWLNDLISEDEDARLFDWQRAIEPPIGNSASYRG